MIDNLSTNLKKGLLVAVALLSVYLLVISIKEIKAIGQNDVPPQNVVSVSGKGEVIAVPDVALFTFGVTQEGKDVSDAQTKATEKINAALKYLKDNGVAEKDIKTVNYSINPVYDYTQGVCNTFRCSPGTQTLRGYEINQMIEVKVRKTEDAGKLLSGIGAQGVTNVSGLSFTVDNEDGIKAQAREAAINDAKAKAEVLAKQLGVKIVRIVNFSESGDYPIYYAKTSVANGRGVAMDMAEQAPSPELPAGEHKVISNVSIVYEIR